MCNPACTQVALRLTVPTFIASLESISMPEKSLVLKKKKSSSSSNNNGRNSSSSSSSHSSSSSSSSSSTGRKGSPGNGDEASDDSVGDGSSGGSGSRGDSGNRGDSSSKVDSSSKGSHTLAQHLVLACSSEAAWKLCRPLGGMGDRCVYDPDALLGNQSLGFHTAGFNLIGFAKIK